MKKLHVVVYTCNIRHLGGVDTFIERLIKRMSKYWDFTLIYNEAESGTLPKFKEYAKTIPYYNNLHIEADVVIFATAWGERSKCSNYTAQELVQTVHADYEAYIKNWFFVYNKMPCVTKHVAVSETSKQGLKNTYGFDSTVIYNLLDDEVSNVPKKKNNKNTVFITASRLSAEKGIERCIKLARQFKKAGKKFVWHIYGTGPNDKYVAELKRKSKDIPEIIWQGYKDNLTEEMREATYLVQLSDTEGFPYSPYEALQVGTPCLLTNYKSCWEQVTDGVNGYILPLDLKKIDIDKIFNKVPTFKFEEKSTEEDWLNLFKDIEPKYPQTDRMCLVEAIRNYYKDKSKNQLVFKGKKILVTEEEAEKLVNEGKIRIIRRD